MKMMKIAMIAANGIQIPKLNLRSKWLPTWMIFTNTANEPKSAATDHAFHDASSSKATTTNTPIHQAMRPSSWRLVMLTRGLRPSGSDMTAIATRRAKRQGCVQRNGSRADHNRQRGPRRDRDHGQQDQTRDDDRNDPADHVGSCLCSLFHSFRHRSQLIDALRTGVLVPVVAEGFARRTGRVTS